MRKYKRIISNCSICKRTLSFTVPRDLAEDKQYFPFEYLHIHGEPKHALLLLLDANLSVRNSSAFADLMFAQKKKKEYENVLRMSDNDVLATIYSEPERLSLLNALQKGPRFEDELIQIVNENSDDFEEEDFNSIVFPFFKANLVKLEYLPEYDQNCYFLIRDFAIFRKPHEKTMEILKIDNKFKSLRKVYLGRVQKGLFNSYIDYNQDGGIHPVETLYLFRFLTLPSFIGVYTLLDNGPMAVDEFMSSFENPEMINELTRNGIITEFEVNGEHYYALLCEIKIEKFIPVHLIQVTLDRFRDHEIDDLIVDKYLEILYNVTDDPQLIYV